MLSNKELNALLKAELAARVTKRLLDQGFRPLGQVRGGKLPFRYWREASERVDMLEFQWDKYHRPSFVINFRPVEHQGDIARFKPNPRENWPHLYSAYFRASDGGVFGERWFKIRLFARIFSPKPAITRLAEKVERRVIEIDEFLKGGKRPRSIGEIVSYDLNDRPHEFFRPPLLFAKQSARRGRY